MPNEFRILKYVLNAIIELGDKNGSPLANIIDLVRTNIVIDDIKPRPRNIASHTRQALQMAIEDGLIVEPIRGRFKIVDEDEEDTFISGICPTLYKNQCQKNVPSMESIEYTNNDNKYCSLCGGKRRCRNGTADQCEGGKCSRRRCKQSKSCERRGSGPCGKRGKCGECRPPPIPRTPCTPPTPRQPCPPSPPCQPKMPCGFVENEGFDCQEGNTVQDNRSDHRSQTSQSINNINCSRSTEAIPLPEKENDLVLGEATLQQDSSNEKEPPRKLYFGPGSLDHCPLINPQASEEQMDSPNLTEEQNSQKDFTHEYIS